MACKNRKYGYLNIIEADRSTLLTYLPRELIIELSLYLNCQRYRVTISKEPFSVSALTKTDLCRLIGASSAIIKSRLRYIHIITDSSTNNSTGNSSNGTIDRDLKKCYSIPIVLDDRSTLFSFVDHLRKFGRWYSKPVPMFFTNECSSMNPSFMMKLTSPRKGYITFELSTGHRDSGALTLKNEIHLVGLSLMVTERLLQLLTDTL